MTDRNEKIRKALVKGPTPGPWELREGRTDTVENTQGYPVCTVNYYPDERYDHGTRAAYIAACDPDTIRVLLDERDALGAENARLREALEPWANEPDVDAATMLRLIKTIKYLVGIAERGEGRKIADDETPEQFVLGYVKRLEQTNQDARAKLREKNGGRA